MLSLASLRRKLLRPTSYKRRIVSLLVLVSCSQRMVKQDMGITNAERGRVLEVAAKGESLIRQEPSYVYQHQIHTFVLSDVSLVIGISHICQSYFQREILQFCLSHTPFPVRPGLWLPPSMETCRLDTIVGSLTT